MKTLQMARLARLVIPGQPHLVLQQALEPVFLDDSDRQAYVAAMRAVAADSGIAVHGYALLDRQVRLLVTPAAAGSLGRWLQRVGRRYVVAFNRRHGRSGTPWDGRYRATVLQAERFLLSCLRQLEFEPVRLGLAARPQDWPWSSAAHHAGRSNDPLISEHPMYWQLGNTPFDRQAAYRTTNEIPLEAAQAVLIDQAVTRGWALGDATYLRAQALATSRRLVPASPGRKAIDSVPK
jgi:putative transposase